MHVCVQKSPLNLLLIERLERNSKINRERSIIRVELILSIVSQIIITATIAVLSYYYKRMSKKLCEQEKVKDGVVAILQDRIFLAGSALISKGEVSLKELKNLENLYSVYHSLGGNSTGTEIFNRVKNLKINMNKKEEI